MKYELHLTFNKEVPVPNNWKQTGWIRGDTNFNGEDRFYLTSYSTSYEMSITKINLAKESLKDYIPYLVRAKVEMIIMDERY